MHVCVRLDPRTRLKTNFYFDASVITHVRDTMAASNAIREEYLSSLADLDQNSKPMIDMLTMLADDHRQHAPIIVDAIKERITQVLHFTLLFGFPRITV